MRWRELNSSKRKWSCYQNNSKGLLLISPCWFDPRAILSWTSGSFLLFYSLSLLVLFLRILLFSFSLCFCLSASPLLPLISYPLISSPLLSYPYPLSSPLSLLLLSSFSLFFLCFLSLVSFFLFSPSVPVSLSLAFFLSETRLLTSQLSTIRDTSGTGPYFASKSRYWKEKIVSPLFFFIAEMHKDNGCRWVVQTSWDVDDIRNCAIYVATSNNTHTTTHNIHPTPTHKHTHTHTQNTQ